MNASRWAAVRAVFDELVELEPTVRAGRLDQLGLTDPQLREDVSALLSADAHADERLGSLDLPVLSPLVSPDHEQRDRLQAALAQRYLIERELGRGGMATVYLARDLKHERLVALKVLQPSLAASLGPERFLREIRTAARLQHPHILAVHDSGTVDTGAAAGAELLWYTMPYVEGESLRQRLAREPRLPLATAVQIALEVADALGHAHRHGVIHRDIKPENILLSSDRPAD